ncbi:MAG TPA: TIGR03118 family protein [Chthonomonadaceae bacterium]|nr:TIGR03118 family protein [Chthonomonadaceae bacterium]
MASFCRRAITMTGMVCIALIAAMALRSPVAAQGYVQTNVVSDIPGLAGTPDTNLKNPWGVSFGPSGPLWVSDNETGVSTLYSLSGTTATVLGLVVAIPPPLNMMVPSLPTGQVFNSTSDFPVTPGNPATFLFASLDGTLSGWNFGVDMNNAHLVVDHSQSGAVYTGLAMADINGKNYLYAANFGKNHIDIFNGNFHPVSFRTSTLRPFHDPNISTAYAPFNIQNIGGKLFVTYARRDFNAAPGLGFVDIFSPRGVLLKRLEPGWWMDAPWGVAVAPSSFGPFANDILIGNFGTGSGWIAAFHPVSGRFVGLVNDAFGFPIINDGLWALTFGNGGSAGDPNILYFTAGIHGGADGLLGALTPSGG